MKLVCFTNVQHLISKSVECLSGNSFTEGSFLLLRKIVLQTDLSTATTTPAVTEKIVTCRNIEKWR
jgi:hypothetical protein